MNTNIDYKLLGQRLKLKRKEKGFTQEQLAEKLNYTTGYISQIERGITKINLDTLADICGVYDCDIADIISGTNKKQSGYMRTDIARLCSLLTKGELDTLFSLLTTYIKNKRK